MKNEKLFFSIIVPVYKVEKCLHRCVDSLLNQTFQNFEIILVDDGSPDGSAAICDDYAEKDARVRVIHKENGGLSSARNFGLDNASGNYILFVDSDDAIKSHTLQFCADLIINMDIDAILYDCQMIYDEQFCLDCIDNECKNEYFENKDILEQFLKRAVKALRHFSVCCGAYKKDLFNNLRFREGYIHEDIDFKYALLKKCKKVVYSSSKLYGYFISTETITTSGLKKKDFDLVIANDLLWQMTKNEKFGLISQYGEMLKARTSFSLLAKIVYYGIDDETINRKQIVPSLLTELRKSIFILLKSPIGFNRKSLAVGMCVNFSLVEIFIQWIKKSGKLTNYVIKQPN